MRVIKFRGKSKLTAEELEERRIEHRDGWVYGSLVTHEEALYIAGEFKEVGSESLVNESWLPVQPESVGQYTGITDKKGRDIYEGDILEYGYVVTYVDGSDKESLGMSVGFHIQQNDFERHRELEVGDFLEIIGNIYDNPELVSGEVK